MVGQVALQPRLTFISKHVSEHALWLLADQGAPEHKTNTVSRETPLSVDPSESCIQSTDTWWW